MNRILVPTDFSLNANKALDYAVHLCKQFNAQLYIAHAVELADTSVGDSTGTTAGYNQQVKAEAEKQLALLRTSITEAEQIPVTTGMYNNDVAGCINEVVQTQRIDCVVMGTLGRTGLLQQFFGSKTAGYVPHAKVPVLVIPPETEWQGVKNILLAVSDFDKLPDKTSAVFELAAKFGATVHVGTFTGGDISSLMVALVQEWELLKCRQEIAASFPDVVVQTVTLKGDNLTMALEEYMESAGMDMIAMVTYKRSFLASVFKPSITRKMTYYTKIPLLAIPANTEQ